LTRPLFGALATDIMPTNHYQATLGPDTAIEAKTKFSHYLGFLLAYYQPVSDHLVLGLGFYTPSETGTTWKGDDFKSLTGDVAYDWKSKIGMMTLSPLVAWKISDRLSLGATFNLNYGEMKWSQWPGQLEISPGLMLIPVSMKRGFMALAGD